MLADKADPMKNVARIVFPSRDLVDSRTAATRYRFTYNGCAKCRGKPWIKKKKKKRNRENRVEFARTFQISSFVIS